MAIDAVAAGSGKKLEQVQAAWSSSVRWSDFEAAWQLVDPELRAGQPLTELELERYRQLQVSSYRERGSSMGADGSVERRVELGVINRNTLAERTLTLTERWRWDPQAKRWWQVEGLPDLWQGQ